jgi:hypothetical protein
MRRVDDRREVLDAHHAHIGDGSRAALVFLGLQLSVLGAAAKILHLVRNDRERLGFRLADDRA